MEICIEIMGHLSIDEEKLWLFINKKRENRKKRKRKKYSVSISLMCHFEGCLSYIEFSFQPLLYHLKEVTALLKKQWPGSY